MQDPTHDSPSSRSSDLHGPISHAGRKGLRSLPLFWWMLHGLYPARRPARPSRPPFKAVLHREDRRDQPGGNHKGAQAAEETPRLAAKPPPNTTPNAQGRHKKGNGKVKANSRQTTLPRIHSRQSSGSKETPFPLRELGRSPNIAISSDASCDSSCRDASANGKNIARS